MSWTWADSVCNFRLPRYTGWCRTVRDGERPGPRVAGFVKLRVLCAAFLPKLQPLLQTLEPVSQQGAAIIARCYLRDGSQQLTVDGNPMPNITRMPALRIFAGEERMSAGEIGGRHVSLSAGPYPIAEPPSSAISTTVKK